MKDEFKDIFKIAGHIKRLQQDAVRQTLAVYAPEVEQIVRLKIKDCARIEGILDRLLDVAFDDDVLKIYKKLCRHYYFINPKASVFYVQSYREMWDEESFEPEADQNSIFITHNSEFVESGEVLGYGE